jgi:hypothetical protein
MKIKRADAEKYFKPLLDQLLSKDNPGSVYSSSESSLATNEQDATPYGSSASIANIVK